MHVGVIKGRGWRQCCNSLNIRRLYEVYVNNGMSYDDEVHFTKVVIAKDRNDALTKVRESDECYFRDYETVRFEVNELDVIDGYRISVEKIK